MLNTLYPPIPASPRGETPRSPTEMLTPDILKAQRDQFFKWIGKVEADGPQSLDALMQQNRRPPRQDLLGNMKADDNGWPAVRDALDAYLRVANAVIDNCTSVVDLSDFTESGKKERKSTDEYTLTSGRESRSGRKADSGVSFSSSEREQQKRASNSSSFGPRDRDARALSLADADADDEEDMPSPATSYEARFPPAKTGSSAMGKIAREIKKISGFGSSSPKTRPETPDSTRGRGRQRQSAIEDEPQRPRSRAGTFIRSLSRVRSRSRPRSAAGERESYREEVPPTPTIPASFMDYSDDERDGRSKIRRSFSQFRSRSNSKGLGLRKMKSFDRSIGRQGERAYGSTASEAESFDVQQMRLARDRWESENASTTLIEDDAEAYGIGEAR